MLIITDICLSDIPKEMMTKSEKNGKFYVKLCVASRKEKDQYENTHTVYVNQSKEQREAKADKRYVGSGKEIVQGSGAQTPVAATDDVDLPF